MRPLSLLQGSRTRGTLLAAASGLLTGLSAPGHFPGLLCMVALVPLLAAVHGIAPKRAFLLGWLAGAVTFITGMYWIAYTIQAYGGISWLLAIPALLLLAAYLGLYTGLFAAGAAFFSTRKIPLALVAPFMWVALEFARAHLFTGLPWNLLGLSLYESNRLIQIADTLGIYGVSAFVVLLNVCIAAVLFPLIDRRRRDQSYYYNHMIILLMVPIMVATYGQVRIASLSLHHQQNPDPDGPLRVTLVQPNIPQSLKWNPGFLTETLNRLERLSLSSTGADLILWPEAALPLILNRDVSYMEHVQQLIAQTGTHLAVGSLALVPDEPGAITNTLYLFDPTGGLLGTASKEHLVPFGEYVPLERFLPFVRKLTTAIGDVRPGETPALLPHPRGVFGVAVCYELIFPSLVRSRFAAGAEILATVTNDAWFGDTAAPEQHLATAAFRAIENRTYVVRAANTGISAMVDPYGLIHHRLDLNTEGAVTVDVDRRFEVPFYSRHGNLFAWLSVIVTVLGIAWGFTPGRSRRRGPEPPAGDPL